MNVIEIKVPDIGDFKDVTVIELLVQPGDTIEKEQSLITVESDKASLEVPSSHAGKVKALKIALGDKVNQGDVLLELEIDAVQEVNNVVAPKNNAVSSAAPSAVASPVTASSVPKAVPPAAVSAILPQNHAHGALVHASPSIRKIAREWGVPLSQVQGTGAYGRITLDDVQAFNRAVMSKAAGSPSPSSLGAGLAIPPWPEVDFSQFGPIETKELLRIKKISGPSLMRNAIMIPSVTNHDDADITELEQFRLEVNKEHQASGIKTTMLAFLIKASVSALKEFPDVNSSLDQGRLVLKKYWNIGFAADTPLGLMVPVIKNADQKGVLQISQEIVQLAQKAKEGKLSPTEMSGATFTLSSLGGVGGRYFTPIINAPEVAILGVCKSRIEPVWNGKTFEPRLMLPLSLTWDHRVIDGVMAARFNTYLSQMLADFRRIAL